MNETQFKVLRTKREPKEFVAIEFLEDYPDFFTSDIPHQILPMTATMDLIKEHYSKKGFDLDLSKYELVEYFATEVSIEKG